MIRLTNRQAEVLDFIERSSIPPTLREIGAELGIKSTNGVNDHLRALERKGRIDCATDSRSRHIVVLLPLTIDERAVFRLGHLRRCAACDQVIAERPEGMLSSSVPVDDRSEERVVERVAHG
jgi:SOS-response transcriptional repressor LexA